MSITDKNRWPQSWLVGLLLCIFFLSVLASSNSAYGSAPLQRIAAGRFTSLFIQNDGSLWAWGTGISTGDDFLTPQKIYAGPVKAVAALNSDFIILLENGDVYGSRHPGPENMPQPSVVPLGFVMHDVEQIAAAGDNAYALKLNGELWAWSTDGVYKTFPKRPVKILDQVAMVRPGAQHSLALMKNGHIRGWGSNYCAQLGGGITDDKPKPVRIRFSKEMQELRVISVTPGEALSVASTDDGSFWHWGKMYDRGYLDYCKDINFDYMPIPKKLPLPPHPLKLELQAIFKNSDYFLFLDSSGALWGWSYNAVFPGDTPSTKNLYERLVLLANDVVAVSAGSSHVLLLKKDNTVWAWGSGTNGQLGSGGYGSNPDKNPLPTYYKTPTQVIIPD